MSNIDISKIKEGDTVTIPPRQGGPQEGCGPVTINIEDIKPGDRLTIYRRPGEVLSDFGEHTGVVVGGLYLSAGGEFFTIPHSLNHIIAHEPAPKIDPSVVKVGDWVRMITVSGLVVKGVARVCSWGTLVVGDRGWFVGSPNKIIWHRPAEPAPETPDRERELFGGTTKSLAVMASEVREVNVEKGWRSSASPEYGVGRSFPEDLALLHSELSEALEAYRKWDIQDATDETLPEIETPGWLPKPEGVGSELADVLIRLLDTAYEYEIDLEAEYERKLAYNKTREWRHGNKRL